MFVARSLPWPAAVHWLRTPTGLYVQSAAALVFQLSGGSLVVRDVVHAEKTLAWPDYWFAELEHAIGDVDAEQQAQDAPRLRHSWRNSSAPHTMNGNGTTSKSWPAASAAVPNSGCRNGVYTQRQGEHNFRGDADE